MAGSRLERLSVVERTLELLVLHFHLLLPLFEQFARSVRASENELLETHFKRKTYLQNLLSRNKSAFIKRAGFPGPK